MNKETMGIRTIIAIIGLSFAAATVRAGFPNSWRAAGNGFWDDSPGPWSLNAPPSITDSADLITNAASKLVTIDSSVVSGSPTTLTISNLTLGGTVGGTNTLLLNTSGTNVPLHVFNAMLVSNAAVLQITNSFLQVDGGAGGMFQLTGTMRILTGAKVQLNKAIVSSGAILQFALGTTTNTVAVSTDLTLGGTLNIINGGGFTNTTYTLFTYGGVLTTSGLLIGATPTNSTCVIDSNTFGQVNLIVSLSSSSSSTASVQLISIVRSTSDIAITWAATGGSTSLVQVTSGAVDGSYNTNNFADIPASQFTPPGSGIVTNTYTETGGATNAPSRFYRIHLFQ
jgi:hypothetical protein